MNSGIQFVKRSSRTAPKVSLVLLDWSVRESFHLLHYLDKQNVPRDWFEVIIIEYYSRISEPLKKFEEHVDNWILLNMPEGCYYHKHLMYNVGIALSVGDIVMIGDSDAMVRETFIESIVGAFNEDPKIAFHIDQFRNMRRDLHPFCYPDYDVVLGDGCINNVNGQTAGVLNNTDPLHSRNYGSCMCAKRADLISIGGADEHIDYLGHICGPYDMTFRLINHGRREVWDMNEFMLHTWHPGQAGADNYMGPHDGKHMSTTAMEALESGRIMPFRENAVIKTLREGVAISQDDILAKLIDPGYLEEWQTENIEKNASHRRWSDYVVSMGAYNGFRITAEVDRLMARPIKGIIIKSSEGGESVETLDGATMEELKAKIDETLPKNLSAAIHKARGAVGRIVAARHVKRWLREYLGSGYRALKFHDRATIKDILKRTLKLPFECIRLPGELKRQIGAVEGEMGSMATALYFAGMPAAQDARPVAVVNHWSQERFLTDIAGKSGFPPFNVEMVSDAESIEATLRGLGEREHAHVVVWGGLYSHFHMLFTSSPVSNNIVVV
jgi:hypothetical protein